VGTWFYLNRTEAVVPCNFPVIAEARKAMEDWRDRLETEAGPVV
jgi:hypothetical protein